MNPPEHGPYYEEMVALYDQFVRGSIKGHYTSYFEKLQLYFTDGSLITRIHALEMILNIILGGKWTGLGSRPIAPDDPSEMSLIQYSLQEIEHRWTQVKQVQIVNDNRDQKIPVDTMISWLFEVLPSEENQDILKVFFIFIKTHWEQLMLEDNERFDQLYDLHHRLLDNKQYAKLEALERLHADAFGSGYRRLR